MKLYKVLVVRRVLRIDSKLAILEQECDKIVLPRFRRWEDVGSRSLIAQWARKLQHGAEEVVSEV